MSKKLTGFVLITLTALAGTAIWLALGVQPPATTPVRQTLPNAQFPQ